MRSVCEDLDWELWSMVGSVCEDLDWEMWSMVVEGTNFDSGRLKH